MTSSWFFLSTRNYDARSTTHQTCFPVLSHLGYSKAKAGEGNHGLKRFRRQRNHFGNLLTSTNQNSREYCIVYEISHSVDNAVCFYWSLRAIPFISWSNNITEDQTRVIRGGLNITFITLYFVEQPTRPI